MGAFGQRHTDMHVSTLSWVEAEVATHIDPVLERACLAHEALLGHVGDHVIIGIRHDYGWVCGG